MAKTYANLLDEARDMLQDTDSDAYRYSTTTLLAILNRALQEIGRIRPDAFYDRFSENLNTILVPVVKTVDPEPDTDPDELDDSEDADVATTDEIDFEMQFYSPLVYFVVASAEIADDEFTTDGRASMLMAQFKQTVVAL